MPSHITKGMTIALAAVVLIILLATAYLAGVAAIPAMHQKGFDDGYAQALADHGVVADASAAEENETSASITGVVTAVADGSLTLQEEIPGSATGGDSYTVVLGDGGIVTGLVPKDPEALAKELSAYNRRIRTNPKLNEAPPSPDVESALSFGALAAGDRITVITSSLPTDSQTVAQEIYRVGHVAPPPAQ